MKIFDVNGKPIEVTDLEKAIEIAEAYKSYYHEDTAFKNMDERLQAYWTDIYLKLLQLKSEKQQSKNDPL